MRLAEKVWCIGEINRLNKIYNQSVSSPEPPSTCNFTNGGGICSLLIRADDRIAPCQFFYDQSLGNIYENTVIEILTHPKLQEFREISEKRKRILANSMKCNGCKVRKGCMFGCIGKANELGNIMSYDGQCDLRVMATVCLYNNLIPQDLDSKGANSVHYEKMTLVDADKL